MQTEVTIGKEKMSDWCDTEPTWQPTNWCKHNELLRVNISLANNIHKSDQEPKI